MHILLIQESDKIMSTRLIIEGNAVYEIDEDCVECQKQKGRFQGRMKKQAAENGSGGKADSDAKRPAEK